MRTHREAKAMAKTLRACLAEKNISTSHSECLEIVARQFGFSEWNVMAGHLHVEAGERPQHVPNASIRLFQVIPVLHVTRIQECKGFYGDFLGFSSDWDGSMAIGTDERPGYALLFRDDIEIHLTEQRIPAVQERVRRTYIRDLNGAQSGSTQGGGSLMIRMSALDAFHRELAARNTGFELTEVRYTPWDSRVFIAVDPFGNRLRFWENNPPGVAWEK
jgi:catechol 2,3-dioxygenase-like lactoylglutathione lyase family enzyme